MGGGGGGGPGLIPRQAEMDQKSRWNSPTEVSKSTNIKHVMGFLSMGGGGSGGRGLSGVKNQGNRLTRLNSQTDGENQKVPTRNKDHRKVSIYLMGGEEAAVTEDWALSIGQDR